jgi:hypothetical protein
MEIWYWQKFVFSCLYPLFSLRSLAFRTVTITATIVTDPQVPAGGASVCMTAHGRTSATPNRVECTQLPCVQAALLHTGPMRIEHTSHFKSWLHYLPLL